jgi:6,7-dimethyl-8-ribityllumazine synthase
LVDHAAVELMTVIPNSRLLLHQVPGAFEIPIVVQELAARAEHEINVIIALGVIIHGDTDHGELLGRTVTDALQQIALANRMPIIHQVLSCKDEAQAKVRCLETKYNRGTEAARAAIKMADLLEQLRG